MSTRLTTGDAAKKPEAVTTGSWSGSAAGEGTSNATERFPPQRPAGSRARQSFDSICSHVQEHFQEPLTRRSVAAEFGVTPNHLSRLFRAEGLMRFWEYVTWVRIDRAKWMLAHYDIPVKEVAMRCGFEESSYFCQVFRRRAKLTPVEYRLKYQRRPRG